MQKQRAAVFLFFVSVSALTLQGCAVKRWLFGPRSTPSVIPQPMSESLPSPSAPSAALSDSSAPLQWDFAQRADQKQTAEPPQVARQTPQATSPLPPPSAPPVQAGSTGLRNGIPGLSDGKGESEDNPQYVTEADLLKVVTEFQRLAGKDTYRFPVPKDVTGANVYKATLTRLRDYEDKHPGAYLELLAFTRGRAYEGLHEYEKAIAQYQIVSQGKNRLNEEASKAIAILTQFREIKQRPLTASTPLAYLQALDSQIAAWQEQEKQQAGTPYEALAREEEERLDWAKVRFLELNRHRFEDGNGSVVLAYRQLLNKHNESKNIYRYQIEFADFYFTLAQEYAVQNDPQSLQFDPAVFEELGRTALRLYAEVAHEDGVMEKLEAKGKLEALEAYMAKVGRLGR
ncbi:MAG: hypothetical protein HY268_22390 [Deltaproteobacteria bacterium]|nr:hypothetical protein [Deltaproteobacteria bacterium]